MVKVPRDIGTQPLLLVLVGLGGRPSLADPSVRMEALTADHCQSLIGNRSRVTCFEEGCDLVRCTGGASPQREGGNPVAKNDVVDLIDQDTVGGDIFVKRAVL